MKKAFQISLSGTVQGVGFRPFVYNLASEMHLCGHITNTPQGITIHIEGDNSKTDLFIKRLHQEKPTHSRITKLKCTEEKIRDYTDFQILKSNHSGKKSAFILQDLATCNQCLEEVFNPENRRYQYPFTNCTHCGPRFSIIESLPYDRGNTSMRIFNMCSDCASEYGDPRNRRFHAQPNACPVCGPHLEMWDKEGNILTSGEKSISMACSALQEGKIVAMKGIGGFQLLCDARNAKAVRLLRLKKNRPDKPFALLYPDVEEVMKDCMVSNAEKEVLLSAQAPIVLLTKKFRSGKTQISANIAPDNLRLGVMLPYSPLHHILMKKTGYPVVATSGNLTNEPICIDENEALDRLQNIADLFLVHNRPIIRAVDDSVVRIIDGGIQVIRNARGYAPQPISLPGKINPIIAVGAHLKNSVAIGSGRHVFMSQHIGNLESPQAFDAFRNVTADLQKLYDINPIAVVCDQHPGYLSTQYAQKLGLPVITVQHHHAHIIAAAADNALPGAVFGVCWDGTGFGKDGTIWGGEFLYCEKGQFERVAHFRTFPLPGGEMAIKEPRRTVIGMLYEMYGAKLKSIWPDLPFLHTITKPEINVWIKMLDRQINSPFTSSAGRLFDGVASILDLRHSITFEGQAAMHLEHIIDADCESSYPVKYSRKIPIIIDWQPIIENIMVDLQNMLTKEMIAAKFHNTLAEIIIDVVSKKNQKKIILSGGCFQNRYLTERTIQRLREEGYKPYIHRYLPPNDGGIAIGQIIAGYYKQFEENQQFMVVSHKHQKT